MQLRCLKSEGAPSVEEACFMLSSTFSVLFSIFESVDSGTHKRITFKVWKGRNLLSENKSLK